MRSNWYFHASFALLALAASPCAFAKPGDMIPLDAIRLPLPAGTQLADIERALMTDLTATLKKFKPDENTTDFSVKGNGTAAKISFTLAVHLGPFGKHVDVKATVKSPVKLKCAAPAIIGYRMDYDLSASDNILVENANLFRLDACISVDNEGVLSMRTRAYMRESSDYGGITGGIAKDTLNSETKPMLEALNRRLSDYVSGRKALENGYLF